MEKFEGSPSQQAVVRLLLERGFSINDEGRVVSGEIEIPNTQIAREIDVDRRVVDSTTQALLDDDELRDIFRNISAVPSLMDLAPVLDFTVVRVKPTDADAAGIVARVTEVVADEGLSIRQVLSDDPEFADEPMLYLILDTDPSGTLLKRVRDLPHVREVSF